eukprot:scaffold8227_cov119-Isochrysis_galbana.AAC.7
MAHGEWHWVGWGERAGTKRVGAAGEQSARKPRRVARGRTSIKSMRRPGVAMTISTPCRKSRSCGPFGTPP